MWENKAGSLNGDPFFPSPTFNVERPGGKATGKAHGPPGVSSVDLAPACP